jgi:hypothetical protein
MKALLVPEPQLATFEPELALYCKESPLSDPNWKVGRTTLQQVLGQMQSDIRKRPELVRLQSD